MADKLRKLVRNAERSPPYFLMINLLIYRWTIEIRFHIFEEIPDVSGAALILLNNGRYAFFL